MGCITWVRVKKPVLDSDGNVIAKSIKLYGDIQMYNQWGGNYQNISADLLAQYAVAGYDAKGEIDDNGYTWSTGAGYGYDYNYATDSNSGNYPSFFRAYSLQCDDLRTFGDFYVGGRFATGWETDSWYDRDGNYHFIRYLAS